MPISWNSYHHIASFKVTATRNSILVSPVTIYTEAQYIEGQVYIVVLQIPANGPNPTFRIENLSDPAKANYIELENKRLLVSIEHPDNSNPLRLRLRFNDENDQFIQRSCFHYHTMTNSRYLPAIQNAIDEIVALTDEQIENQRIQ